MLAHINKRALKLLAAPNGAEVYGGCVWVVRDFGVGASGCSQTMPNGGRKLFSSDSSTKVTSRAIESICSHSIN